MKKVVLILTVFFLISTATAVSTNMKEVYSPGETMILEISGNILSSIEKEDIELRRGHVQVPFDYNIAKLGNSYFLYAILPQNENNYSLWIKNIQTNIDGQIKIIDYSENFSTQGPLVTYFINPGFISTAQDNTGISITLNTDSQEEIEIGLPEPQSVSLRPGENNIQFSISSLDGGLSFVNIGMYSMPIYYLKQESENNTDDSYNNSIDENTDYNFVFSPKSIESIVLVRERKVYPVRIANFGNDSISNIELIFNEDLFEVDYSDLGVINPGEEVEINIILLENNQPFNEIIRARIGDYEITLPIIVRYTENESDAQTPYLQNYSGSSSSLTYLCSELNGRFCSANEECSGEVVQALDGNSCCLSQCRVPETKSSLAWIGYLIGAIVLIIAVIIGGRYLKTKKLSASKP